MRRDEVEMEVMAVGGGWSEMTVGRVVNSEKGISEKKDRAECKRGEMLGVFILAPQFQAAAGRFNNGAMPTPDGDKCVVGLFHPRCHTIGCGGPSLLVMANLHG